MVLAPWGTPAANERPKPICCWLSRRNITTRILRFRVKQLNRVAGMRARTVAHGFARESEMTPGEFAESTGRQPGTSVAIPQDTG
jgi:AraC-like DNA-binding protein